MDETPERKPVAGMATVTLNLVLALGLAFGINAVLGPRPLAAALREGAPLVDQLLLGTALGLAFCIPVVTAVLRLPGFSRLREHSIERARMIDLRGLNPVWVSLVAGVGEELLFRGAIQPLAGLWLTSVLFALVHVQPRQYRSPTAGTVWYAAFVFLVSLLLGFLCARVGLIAAMSFHTTGDLVGLFALRFVSRAAADGTAAAPAPGGMRADD